MSARFDNQITIQENECYIGQPYSGYALRGHGDTDIIIIGMRVLFVCILVVVQQLSGLRSNTLSRFGTVPGVDGVLLILDPERHQSPTFAPIAVFPLPCDKLTASAILPPQGQNERPDEGKA